MKKKIFIAFAFVALLFSSCAAPNVSYFNDMGHGQTENAIPQMDILLRPDDKISIVVKSKDPALSELFNLSIATRRVGYTCVNLEFRFADVCLYGRWQWRD